MRMPAHRGLHEETGFTLIELVVAMPLMLIVVGGMTLVLTTLTNYNSQNQESLTLQTEARSAINRMETEIRGAFYGDGVTSPISAATATSITLKTPDEYGRPSAEARWRPSTSCASPTRSRASCCSASFRRAGTRFLRHRRGRVGAP